MTSQQNASDDLLDPLVWHYERERRIRMDGIVQWEHKVENRALPINFRVRVNLHLVANATYLDVLIPTNVPREHIGEAIAFVQQNAKQYASKGPIGLTLPGLKEQAKMAFQDFPDADMTSDDCQFTGRIFLYTHYLVQPESKITLSQAFREDGLYLIVRDEAWIEKVRKMIDRPVVFLSHDSSDKDDLVRELAQELHGGDMKVWYDEFSLKPGVRLRKSLDEGLEQADYFVPIITESFLANAKYAQYEIDAMLQKYITEKKPIIIPVCVGVSPSRLKEVSRVLSDTVAIVHSGEHTIKQLAGRIANAIDPKVPHVGEPLPAIVPKGKPGLFTVGVSIGPAAQGREGHQPSD